MDFEDQNTIVSFCPSPIDVVALFGSTAKTWEDDVGDGLLQTCLLWMQTVY
jgi:hypothetical protein